MKIIVSVALLVAYLAVASEAYYPPPANSAAGRNDEHQNARQPPMPYNFEYAVKDEPSNNDFGHQESSDGKVVTGSYRVLLPDGRTQIVTYRADENGYVADVRYEGGVIFPPPGAFGGAGARSDLLSKPKPAYPKY